MRLLDDTGAEVVLGDELARGGEGRILALPARPQLLAKVYHATPGRDLVAKLACMVGAADLELRTFAAWPVGLLTGESGAVAGFLMARVAVHKPLHLLTGSQSREEHFPGVDWSFLVRTAANVAGGFQALHARGHLVGDVNESNLLVSPSSGSVVLVDCDSFQVRGPERTFPCRVAVPHFLPPELQGRAPSDAPRTPDQEAFSLAVLLFQLLFLGRHPFSGCWRGSEPLPLEQAIAERRFAFGPGAQRRGMTPPPLSVPFEVVGREVGSLFDEAFTGRPADRPPASAWREALGGLAASLVTCPEDPAHVRPGHQARCPWCQLERAGGLFFVGAPARLTADAVTPEMRRLVERYRAVAPPPTALPDEPLGNGEPRGTDGPEPGVGRPAASMASSRRALGLGGLVAGATVALHAALRAAVGTPALAERVAGGLVATNLALTALGVLLAACLVARALLLARVARRELAEHRDAARRCEGRAKAARHRFNQASARCFRRAMERDLELRILERKLGEIAGQFQEGLREARAATARRRLRAALAEVAIGPTEPGGLGTAARAQLRWLGVRTAADLHQWIERDRDGLADAVGAAPLALLEAWVAEKSGQAPTAPLGEVDRRALAAAQRDGRPRAMDLLAKLTALVARHETESREGRLELERLAREAWAAAASERAAARRSAALAGGGPEP